MVDNAFVSALSALMGTFVGGITSIATSWVGQHYQTREQLVLKDKGERQDLYKRFIREAAALYVDALEHDTTEITHLVDIYATINNIRVVASPPVVDAANDAFNDIIDAYSGENRTFADIKKSISDIRESTRDGYPDPLQKFSEACHLELNG